MARLSLILAVALTLLGCFTSAHVTTAEQHTSGFLIQQQVAAARRILQIGPIAPVIFNVSDAICSLLPPSTPNVPAELLNRHCGEGYSCMLPLQPETWVNSSDNFFYQVESLNQTNYIPPINASNPENPDSSDLNTLYAAVQLCHFCLSSQDQTILTYGPCYELRQPDNTICANVTAQPIAALGICMPCRGGQFCPPGTNSTTGFVYDDLCEAGSYCPGFGESVTCPAGSFCPTGSRAPVPCNVNGSFCDVGSSDPLTVCAAGYFCPNSSIQIPCPKRSFCRAASVEPRECAFFSYCPEGTEVPIQVWVGLFLAIVLLTILAIIRRSRGCIRRTIKRVLRTASCIAKSSSSTHDEEPHKPAPRVSPAIPSPKFSITLRNLSLQKGSNKILNGIDVKFRSGVIMIQGTSGCGKSTLIKCMSGKTQNELSSLTGSITFSDGAEGEQERTSSVHAFPQNPLNTPLQCEIWSAFQSHVGFVPQDDVVHDDLSVKDNISFAIKLRRPGLTETQQEALLEEMLTELQLTKQRRNLITNVSGGQRKRVNIAWDRCADPQFLILDEPTSGLDATTSLSLMQQLIRYCYPTCLDPTSTASIDEVRGKSEKMVLMVIHQPRIEIFEAATQVIFMDRGRIVYSGPPKLVNEFFRSDPWLPEVAKVFPVLLSKNSAIPDFAMDYVNCFNAYEKDGYPPAAGSTHMSERWLHESTTNPIFFDYVPAKELPVVYAEWQQTLQIVATPRPTGFEQFHALLLRHVKKFSHAIDSMTFDLALIIFAAFASGLINGSGWTKQEYPGIALMSVVAMGALASVVNVRLYGNDRLQTRRELQSGMSPVWYWLSVFLMDLGRLISYPFVFFVIFYNNIVPSSPAIPMYVVYWLIYWACGGFGQFMSLLTSNQTAYLAGALLPLTIGGFLNGVSPTLNVLKASIFLYVGGSCSFARWACERLCSLEFMQLPPYQASLMEGLFARWGFNRHDGDEAVAWLFVMGVIMRIASIIVLVSSTAHIRQRTRTVYLRLRAALGTPFPTSSLSISPPSSTSKQGLALNASSPYGSMDHSEESDSKTAEKAAVALREVSITTMASSDTGLSDAAPSDITLDQMQREQLQSGERTGLFSPFAIFLVVLALSCVAMLIYLNTY